MCDKSCSGSGGRKAGAKKFMEKYQASRVSRNASPPSGTNTFVPGKAVETPSSGLSPTRRPGHRPYTGPTGGPDRNVGEAPGAPGAFGDKGSLGDVQI